MQRCAGRKPNGLDFRSYNAIAGSLTSWTLLLIWGIGTIWETVWECSVWSWSHLAAVARGFDWSNIWQKTAHFRHRFCAVLTQKWHPPCSFWMYWEHLLNTETKSIELLVKLLKKNDPQMRALQEVVNTTYNKMIEASWGLPINNIEFHGGFLKNSLNSLKD